MHTHQTNIVPAATFLLVLPSEINVLELGHTSCVSWCRANFRVLALIVGISCLAAFNALYVPLHLERVIHTHPRSVGLLHAAKAAGWQLGANSTLPGD